MGITKENIIDGGIAALVDKSSELILEFLVSKIGEAESDSTQVESVKKLAREFFRNEELGKAAVKLAMASIIEGVVSFKSEWAENKYVDKVKSECYTSGMTDVMTFTADNIIEIAKSLIPTFVSLKLKDEAKVLKNVVIEKVAEKKEFDMSGIDA